jgi:hypothetical protein
MMRRLLGILLAASMAHLAIAGADATCATPGDHAATTDHSAMAGMHHHDGGQPAKAPCKIPAHSDCCAAGMTCPPAVTARRVAPRADLLAMRADALRFALVPPEPPPPKA